MKHSSTCNAVGVPVGIFIGATCFTLITSENFRNQLLSNSPGTGGLMTMKSTGTYCFMYLPNPLIAGCKFRLEIESTPFALNPLIIAIFKYNVIITTYVWFFFFRFGFF